MYLSTSIMNTFFYRCGAALLGIGCFPFVAQIAVSQHIIPSPRAQRIESNQEQIVIKSTEVLSANAKEYKHGDPTADEQLSLEYMNRARANPTAEGIRLMDTEDKDAQFAYTYFNINKKATKAAFTEYPVQPPLAFNEKLIDAARKHSLDMKLKNFQGHDGSDGSDMSGRVNKAGYIGWSRLGENVAAYSKSVWHGHCGLNVDWGEQNQIELGHRKNIMNFQGGVFTEVGVGIEYRPGANNNQTGPFIITQDFGHKGEYFVTGVVYKDNNNNNFYDVGEGIKGVTLTPSKGDFFAISSTSGGYAIPVKGLTGSLSVTATGGPFTTPTTLQISLSGNQNVKLDFTPNLPGVIALIAPPDMEYLSQKVVNFEWGKSSKPATNYGFELASDEEFKAIITKDETLKDTKITIPDLKNNTTYYWRVRAKTTAGWGDYSLPYSFTVAIAAPEVSLVYPADKSVIKENSVALRWKKTNPLAERYKVQLCTDRFFFDNILEDSTLKDTTKTFSDLEWDTDLYWRVAAFADGVWGNYSDIYGFSVQQPAKPSAPTLVEPADNLKLSKNEIDFIWTTESPDVPVLRHWLEISNQQNFSTYVYKDTAITEAKVTVKDLEYGKTFFWRTKSKNTSGWGEFSEMRGFTIFPLSVNEENAIIQTGLRLSPNPSSQRTSVNFSLKQPASVIIEIINIEGISVQKMILENIPAMNHTVNFDTSSLITGMYTIRVQAGGATILSQLSIVK